MNSAQDDDQHFVQFQSGDSLFAIKITDVREVTDVPTLVPYPEGSSGHIGLANVRGEILPVIAFHADNATSLRPKHGPGRGAPIEHRLAVLEFVKDERFCILVTRPRLISAEALQERPIRVLDREEVLKNVA